MANIVVQVEDCLYPVWSSLLYLHQDQVLPVPPPRSILRGWESPRSSQASKVLGSDTKSSDNGDRAWKTPLTPGTSVPLESPTPIGTAWEEARAHLLQMGRIMSQLERAAIALTEASVSLQHQVGIDEELASQELGSLTRRTSREDSPPVEVSRERLALVGEP